MNQELLNTHCFLNGNDVWEKFLLQPFKYQRLSQKWRILYAYKKHNCSRRDFLKAAGAASVGAIFAALSPLTEASQGPKIIPTRLFGKTGTAVPILAFGGSLDTSMSLLVLRQAFKRGVTYWDTANTYMGGGQVNTDSDTELKPAGRFLQKGFKASRVQGLK